MAICRKLLLHFRQYQPSMAIAENCSCIFGIPTIHGHKKKRRDIPGAINIST
jgi:hypothetical protein